MNTIFGPSIESTVQHRSLVEVLRWRATHQPDCFAYTFLQDDGCKELNITYQEIDRQARSISATLQKMKRSGERALLLYPPGLEYIAALFACFYSEVPAIPTYFPQTARQLKTLCNILKDSGATLALTNKNSLNLLQRHTNQAQGFDKLQWVVTDEAVSGMEGEWEDPSVAGERLAFLQYTSGSTAAPKGVMLTHANLIHNLEMIKKAFEHDEESTFVGWLPLYHDMGLIGNVFQPLYIGARSVLMSPLDFLQRPFRWLEAISRYKAHTSGGPDFAYRLCAQKIGPDEKKTLNLNHWRIAFNGAEPVRRQTMELFTKAFVSCGFRWETFYPCYGLAEATLFVTGGLKAASPVTLNLQTASLAKNQAVVAQTESEPARTLVGCGRAWLNQHIAVVDPDTLRRCPAGAIGEIWISGPSIAKGYWGQPKTTDETFNAFITGSGEGPFLRTGDLGFVNEEELFVTSRLKDLIIIRGRNYYPHDLELTVQQSHPSLRPGCCAAFSLEYPEGEKLIVIQEIRQNIENTDLQETINCIRRAVVEEHDLQVSAVVLIKSNSIPKTSSGKIQRYACRNDFLADTMDVVFQWRGSAEDQREMGTASPLRDTFRKWGNESIRSWLIDQFTNRNGLQADKIDIEQPLTQYGLDSITAINLIHSIESTMGVNLPVAVLFNYDIRGIADKILELIESPSQSKAAHSSLSEQLDLYPLSQGQLGLWFLNQLDPGDPAYVIARAVHIRSNVDVTVVHRAFQEIVKRHSVLRTTYSSGAEGPVQRIHKEMPVGFQSLDASGWSEQYLTDRLAHEANLPFDLEKGPPIRVVVFTKSPDESVLLFAVHHIAADLWSLAVIVKELGQFYDAFKNGADCNLAPIATGYADYVRRQSDMLSGPEGKRLLDYWQGQLSSDLPVLDLPIYKTRPTAQTHQAGRCPFEIDADTTLRLKTLAGSYSATLNMILLGGLQTLLHRYTGQDEILVGVPASGRTYASLANVVGYFVNPVIIRSDFSGNPTFETFLGHVRQTVLEALTHQDLPFEVLVERLRPARNQGCQQLIQFMFVFQKAQLPEVEDLTLFAVSDSGARMKLGSLSVESVPIPRRVAQYDLTLELAEVGDGLKGAFLYNSNLFEPLAIRRLASHYSALLKSIVENPRKEILGLGMLTDDEKQKLLGWNSSRRRFHVIDEIFQEQARSRGDRIAIVCGNEQISYQELDRRSNCLGRYLSKMGVGPEKVVAIFMSRRIELAISALGTLKAGGAYLPIDELTPGQRVDAMLEQAGVEAVITEERLKQKIAGTESIIISIDGEDAIWRESADEIESKATGENSAYVIYTSGTTGRPKGVMVTHSNLIGLFEATEEKFNFNETDVWSLFHSISFDFSVWELWGPLLKGGRLVMAPYWTSRDPEEFYRLLRREEVTILNQTPSAFMQLQEIVERSEDRESLKLRTVIFGGEVLEEKRLDWWKRRYGVERPELVNMYGITETTVHVSYRRLTEKEDPGRWSVIGRAIEGYELYILDERREQTAIGVVNEIYVGGKGLSRGYIGDAGLTAEKFTPNPYGSAGSRTYRSGDLGRYREDGNIEYVGRKDRQVKIRGHRIELAEIEYALAQHQAIRDVKVLLKDSTMTEEGHPDPSRRNATGVTELRTFLKNGGSASPSRSGGKKLIAYLTFDREASAAIDELRRFLSETLPEYMIPSAFIFLDQMPLTENGKIDLKALPKPDRFRPQLEGSFVSPRNDIERTLAGIWSRVLGIDQIGVDDSFFALGGDSIRSLKVRSLAEASGLNYSLQDIFHHQTIRELAAVSKGAGLTFTKRATEDPFSLLPEADRLNIPDFIEDAYPMASIQAGLIFHSEFSPDSAIYRDIFSYEIKGRLDLSILQASIQHFVNENAILRTSFDLKSYSEPIQLVHRNVQAPMFLEDLRGLSPADQQTAMNSWVEAEKKRHFDWTRPPLIRFYVHRLAEDRFSLTLSFHDCILDGWSVASLLTGLLQRYHSLLTGAALPAEPARPPYRDFVALEREAMQSEESRRFWEQHLKDCAITNIPRWSRPITGGAPQIGVVDVFISPELSENLKKAARAAEVPIKHILLAAHLKVLSALSGQTDVMTGLESNGRPEVSGGEQTLGIYINTLPFRMKLASGSWIDLARAVFEKELELSPHRRYPYAALQKNLGGQPFFDSSFNYTYFHVFKSLQNITDIEFTASQGFEMTHFTLKAEFNQDPFSDLIQLDLECNMAELTQRQVESIAERYTNALQAIARDPFGHYETETLLSVQERRQLLAEWNNTRTKRLDSYWVPDLFELQVARTPDSIAIKFGPESLTYKEFEVRSNQLAGHLIQNGVRPLSVVALLLERSLLTPVAAMAVLKTGAAYLPIDTSYPEKRISYMLDDSKAQVVISAELHKEKAQFTAKKVICLDAEWSAISCQSSESTLRKTGAEGAAYVIYTSGSTGESKGVVGTHRGVINRLNWMWERYEFQPGEKICQKTSLSFVDSVWEMFGGLLKGVETVIFSEDEVKDVSVFLKRIEEEEVTRVIVVPSLLKEIVELGAEAGKRTRRVRCWVSSGEELTVDLADKFRRAITNSRLLNLYGSTEVTADVTYCEIMNTGEGERIPLGRPISNTEIYILDDLMQPVGVGAEGEIYVGGDGLAMGYYGKGDLTAERFTPNPYGEIGARLHRTGDKGRYVPDGNIEFLGRRDFQVKIRGFRIEPAEIEKQLMQHPLVESAVVVEGKDAAGSSCLCAYLVVKSPLTASEIRSFILNRLPYYMAPAYFVYVDSLPLKPNGKIDRKALPEPYVAANTDFSFEAPETEIEKKIADLWVDVLGVEQVGVHDSFFELGGHSLNATRVALRLGETFNMNIAVKLLFLKPTIRGLAAVIEKARRIAESGAPIEDRLEELRQRINLLKGQRIV